MEAIQPQGPEDLPRSLYPIKTRPASEVAADEIERLIQKEQVTHPVPDDLAGPDRARRSNLTQHTGGTPEGRRRSLGNLRRRVKDMTQKNGKAEIVKADPTVPAPKVRMQWPLDPNSTRGRAIRAVTSQEEYNIYIESWNEWMTAHADEYTEPEDLEDLNRICMEKVIQFRLDLLQSQHPRCDVSKAYNQSVQRMQAARANLDATRAARTGSKNSGKTQNNTFNIAIAAGNVPVKQLASDARANINSALDRLGQTGSPAPEHEVVDAEFEVRESGDSNDG